MNKPWMDEVPVQVCFGSGQWRESYRRISWYAVTLMFRMMTTKESK